MDLNEKQKEEEACRRTEASTSDREHRIDIPGTTRHANWFSIQGKSLEELERDEDGQALSTNSAFGRVRNRLWIKQNTLYNELLQDGEQNVKLLTERVDRREKRLEDLTNQVFNLVGFFSVFQGVILTAVTQLATSVTTQLGTQRQARPLCGKVWVPVILSALAAFVTILSVLIKFKHLYALDNSLNQEKYNQTVRGFSHATYLQSFVVAVSS